MGQNRNQQRNQNRKNRSRFLKIRNLNLRQAVEEKRNPLGCLPERCFRNSVLNSSQMYHLPLSAPSHPLLLQSLKQRTEGRPTEVRDIHRVNRNTVTLKSKISQSALRRRQHAHASPLSRALG